jgi:hypothetical protein
VAIAKTPAAESYGTCRECGQIEPAYEGTPVEA